MILRSNAAGDNNHQKPTASKTTRMPPLKKKKKRKHNQKPKNEMMTTAAKKHHIHKTNHVDVSRVSEDLLNILLDRYFPVQEEDDGHSTKQHTTVKSKQQQEEYSNKDKDTVMGSDDSDSDSEHKSSEKESSDSDAEYRASENESSDEESNRIRKRRRNETKRIKKYPLRGRKMRKRNEEVPVRDGAVLRDEVGDSTPQLRQGDEEVRVRNEAVISDEVLDSTPHLRQRDEEFHSRDEGIGGDVTVEETEEDPGIVTLNFGAHNYQGYDKTNNTGSVKPSTMNSSKKRKGRGITIMPDLKEDPNGVRMVVQYNSKGQPKGPVATKLATFVGVLARNMVPVHYESWFAVPKELKETLLKHVEDKYIIDPRRRNGVFVAMSNSWRSFKSTLTQSFIFPLKDQPELLSCPPEPYNFIKQEHWDAFVRSRLTKEFQKLSKCNSEIRAKDKYPLRLGRRSYANLLEELKQKSGLSVDELDRCILWKKARQNKDGSYINDDVREKAELIDALIEQKERGNLVIQGSKDILRLALGTPEKPERVRGVGGYITPKTYFSPPEQNSEKYVGELREQVDHQANIILEMSQTNKNLQAQLNGMAPQDRATVLSSKKFSNVTDKSDNKKHLTNADIHCPLPTSFETFYQATDKWNTESDAPPNLNSTTKKTEQCRLAVDSDAVACGNITNMSDNSKHLTDVNDHYNLPSSFEHSYQPTDNGNTESDVSPPSYNSGTKKNEQCRLAVDSKSNIVARGMVYERRGSIENIHNVPLGESNVRVMIEYAISPDARLPIPVIGEMNLVKDAIGSFVAWPKEFVLTGLEEEKHQTAEDKSGPIQAFAEFLDQIMATDNVIIPIPNGIFEEGIDAHLTKADMVHLCKMQEITASCITTYIRFLCGIVANYQELYGFINPASVSYSRGGDVPSIIAKRLQTAKKDQLFFVPYNTGGHWVLIVIDSLSMDVYWLDPMQKPPSMTVKIYVTTGLKAVQTDGKRRTNPTWHCVKCPKQALEVQCGYYVMRYMRELMEERSLPLAEKVLRLAESSTYKQDQVDEIRLELIDFILTHM